MTMSWPGRDEQESLQTLNAALDAGVTLLDTADRYGDGDLGALDVHLSKGDLAELERISPPGAAVSDRKSPTGMELTAP